MAKQAPPQPMTAPSFPSPGQSGSAQMPGKVVSKGDTYIGHTLSKGNSMEPGKGSTSSSHRSEAFSRGVISKEHHAPAPHREKKMRGEGNY